MYVRLLRPPRALFTTLIFVGSKYLAMGVPQPAIPFWGLLTVESPTIQNVGSKGAVAGSSARPYAQIHPMLMMTRMKCFIRKQYQCAAQSVVLPDCVMILPPTRRRPMKSIRRLCPIVVLLFIITSARAGASDGRLDIYFIDVEGGAATLMVTPAGESVL